MGSQYLKLGVFVVAGILLFVSGIFLISKNHFSFGRSFQVEARFNNAGGLRKGAQVRVAGVEKGVIDKLIIPDQPKGQTRVIMKMHEDTRKLINPEAVAQIRSQGFFGERYVELELHEPTSSDAQNAGNNADYVVVRATEMEDFDKIIAQASNTLQTIQDAAQQYRELGYKINSNDGTIGKLLNDKELYQDVRNTVQSVQGSSTKLQEIVSHIRSGKGTLGAMVYGRELNSEISATIADARQSAQKLTAIMNEIQSGKGTIGRLIKDESMANDLQATLRSGRAAAASLQEMLNRIEHGEGPLGALVAGNGSSGIGGIGSTLKEAHSAVVQMNEVLAAAKTNFLLRGYFQDRGYFNAAELAENQFDEPANAKVVKEYSFNTNQIFDNKKINAKLKHLDLLYPIGVYLMNQPYSVVAIKVYLSPVGKEAENLELSQARAFMIREFLAKNFPLDEKKLKIKGYGEDYEGEIPQIRGAGLVRISVYE